MSHWQKHKEAMSIEPARYKWLMFLYGIFAGAWGVWLGYLIWGYK